MCRLLFRCLAALFTLGMCQMVPADDGLPPYNVWLDCDPAFTVGNPALEPIKGKSKAQMVYLGNEEFCYRIKFKCDRGLMGGTNVGCFCDLNDPGADGGVGGFFHVENGPPTSPDSSVCDGGFGHLRNDEFSHSCSFDSGGATLRVEAVDGKKCRDLPPPDFPTPP